MNQTKLYIFATSADPDPYINAIAHCAVNYENLNQVTLVGITEDRGKIGATKDDLNKLKQYVDNQLDNLSKGKYLRWKDSDFETLNIQIKAADCQRYSSLRNIPVDIEVWVYRDLEQEISSILTSLIKSCMCIFDVTAVLKRYLIDIYTILRFNEVSTIHYFELVNKPSHDYRDLIHELTDGKTYKYTCLAESSYTKDRIVTSRDSVISNSTFNQLQSELEILKNECNSLEDIASTDFAKFWSLIYFLIGLPFFIWICWYLFHQSEGWNRVEPIAFIFTFGWFLFNYILQGIFAGKFPSLDPRESFKALKNWRKKGLEKSRLNSSNKF